MGFFGNNEVKQARNINEDKVINFSLKKDVLRYGFGPGQNSCSE